ncbi:glycoside hydrolase 43 family protein [Agromyces luteolus]|uniref:Family 43 glycosylhydrolase n=1 Tax=Agromyces luteolus TaxID=88373 RepID=A0A7C9HSR2_9MICO|nr:family 43 glycosylhydrolase [Agromyces luteolus]MUN08629.1 family 43 glycosylhydrolase [Agromyces luteolus]GLK27169.1 glycoside hydrolase 43 family protein [Agromyces luteolus]
MSAAQPVIPGFYPDPSICRVGDTYYLASSSFEYRPAVPIHESQDLVDWTFVGNAITTSSQLADSDGTGSTGVFAPTLRHHDGLFWLITTDVVDGTPEQTLQHAEDVRGPWSAPVRTRGAGGIDPDISWDGADCYLTWSHFDAAGSEIRQARVDPYTAELLEEPRLLWSGTGLAFPEGPHIFFREGWWYLLIAEGGTERGHCVSIARGPSPRGPFAGAPQNPIFSHRSLPTPVQNVGHADLVECSDGSWAMAYLGVRPRGTSPGFHVNGRETFVAGIDWRDGWPVVDEERFVAASVDTSFIDDFAAPKLHGRWISPGVFPDTFARGTENGLLLESRVQCTLGVRTRDDAWTAEAELSIEDGSASMEVRIDRDNAYGIALDGSDAVATIRIGGMTWSLGAAKLTDNVHRLRIRARSTRSIRGVSTGPDRIELAVGDAHDWRVLGDLDGRYLSTEVTGGFTGRIVGVAVENGRAVLRRFSYTTGETMQ